MDRLQQLTRYINRMVSDTRLKPVHLSLSLAVCQGWIANQFQHPHRISRRLMMKASRIRSKTTYHKALKDLQAFGYLEYFPSYHPHKASTVVIPDEVLTGDGQEGKAQKQGEQDIRFYEASSLQGTHKERNEGADLKQGRGSPEQGREK